MATHAKPEKVEKKPHPLAGQELQGSDIVMQVLADEGVDTIFGYSGGAILPTYDGVFRYNESHPDKKIRLVVPANEQGAGFMAAGYARSTGKVGVLIVTSGPGATNCVTPIRDSAADSVPVVMISGQVARASIGTDAFQEAPVFNIMSSAAKHTFLVTDENELEETIRSAFHIARSGRPGPVVIDIPKDVQNSHVKFKGEGLLHFRGYNDRMRQLHEMQITDKIASRFFRLLENSSRPLVYAGGGVICSGAAETLRTFIERYQLPCVTTLMGIGSIDTQHDLSMRMLGMHGTAFANYAVQDCDFFISIGARFDDRVTSDIKAFLANAKIAHIDIDASEHGKVKIADWGFHGDVRKTLEELMEHGKDFNKDFSPWVRHCQELRKNYPMDFNRETADLMPEYVLEELNKLIQGEAIVATGVGQHQMWAAQYIDVKEPRAFLTSGSMGTMGFGLPASIGAQTANPDRMVIDIDGDGSMRMNIGELETAVTYNIPVKVLMLNNNADGMVLQWQDLFYEKRYSGTEKNWHTKDFVKHAQADGFKFARRVEKKEDLHAALEAFIAFKDGPAFLEVAVAHSHVYPMIAPGKSYAQMLTGPFIKAREEVGDIDVSNTNAF
ncbi:biosynthetic-type acetolactate synthase large subunit [Candidatus Sumerlaeota bacterium]|nr:biosynthetic-type acetolactate synthase large subunit [Candidatus Sumerlaeota bacterium]